MKLVLFCCIVLVLQKGLEKRVSANSDNNVCTIRNREKERGCVCVCVSVCHDLLTVALLLIDFVKKISSVSVPFLVPCR